MKSSGPVARKSSSPGASTDGLVLQTVEDSAPQGPTTPLGFSPADTYRHRQQNLELQRLDSKPQLRIILHLNYI